MLKNFVSAFIFVFATYALAQTTEQKIAALNSLNPSIPMLSLDFRNSPGHPSMSEQKFLLSSPVYKTDDGSLTVSLNGGRVHFQDDLVLDSGLVVPKDLSRAELSANYTHRLPEMKTWSLKLAAGSASDQLFANSHDTTLTLHAQYGFPAERGGFWMLGVFMSNNSLIGNYIPFPTVVYIHKTPTFTGMFGFPILSMRWTPEKPWTHSFFILGPIVVAESAYGEIQDVQGFIHLSLHQQNYILKDRPEDKDRLTIEEKKFAIGARTFLFDTTELEGQIGQAFGRTVYMGQGFRDMRRGSVNLDKESFLAVSLKTGF